MDKISENRRSRKRASEQQSSGQRASSHRASSHRASSHRASAKQVSEQRVSEQRASAHRASAKQVSEQRVSEQRASKRRARRIGIICTVLTGIITAVLVILTALFVGVIVFGITPYTILSSSMTPSYRVGDLVYVRETDPDEIQVGDVIIFTTDNGSVYVTHRVAEKKAEECTVYTKGDANEDEDIAPVPYEHIIGKVIGHLPSMGYVARYLVSRSGRYLAFVVGSVLILLMILPAIAV